MPQVPEVIHKYITEYNNLNVDGMLDCLTNEVEFQNISNNQINAHTTSKGEFKDLANIGVQAFTSRKQTIVSSITVSNLTLAEIRFNAVVAADLPNGWQAEQELNFTGRSAFEIKNGKISKIIDQS